MVASYKVSEILAQKEWGGGASCSNGNHRLELSNSSKDGLRMRSNNFQAFSVAMNENTDVSGNVSCNFFHRINKD
jgi:hypothetical protein